MIVGEYGNSIERHLARHYQKFRSLSKTKQRLLVDATLQYAFRFMNAKSYEALFRATVGEKIRMLELRRTLLSDGYVMKNLKLFVYYSVVNRRKEDKTAHKAFRVKAHDKKVHRSILPVTRKRLIAMMKEGRRPMTLAGFDEACVAGLDQVHSYTRKFVSRKMKFIMTSDSQELHDLASNLEVNGLQAVMLYYPAIETMEHLVNIMKRTIHNTGINLIELHTSEKRGRLGKSEDGSFYSKTLPIHAAAVAKEAADLEKEYGGGSIDGNENDTFQLKLEVEKLISKFSDKRQHFLSLLMGTFNQDFTEYLKRTGVTSVDNDVFWERVEDITEYIRHALDYLNVSYGTGEKFLQHLRKVLADFREAA